MGLVPSLDEVLNNEVHNINMFEHAYLDLIFVALFIVYLSLSAKVSESVSFYPVTTYFHTVGELAMILLIFFHFLYLFDHSDD